MSCMKTFPIMDNWGQEGRFVGNYPAKGMVYDKVKCAFRRIGEEVWHSDTGSLSELKRKKEINE